MVDVVDPADALQAGIYARLAGDAELMTMVGDVADELPEQLNGDFVVIGEALSTPDGTHDHDGRQTVATIHTWTRARGSRPGNRIGARVVALLARRQAELDPLVAGHAVWMVLHEFHQNLVDPKPGIRHRVDRFRIFTSQEDA